MLKSRSGCGITKLNTKNSPEMKLLHRRLARKLACLSQLLNLKYDTIWIKLEINTVKVFFSLCLIYK